MKVASYKIEVEFSTKRDPLEEKAAANLIHVPNTNTSN